MQRLAAFHTPLDLFLLMLGTLWISRRKKWLARWVTLYQGWLNRFKEPLHIVQYKRLESHLVDEMRTLVHFLGWNITDRQLECVRRNAEGKFHRKKKSSMVDPWTGFSRLKIDAILSKIDRWPCVDEI